MKIESFEQPADFSMGFFVPQLF